MSITAYSKFRRQNLRRAWHFASMTEWCRNVGLYIVAFFAALLFVQWISDKAIAEDNAVAAKHRAERAAEKQEAAWLSCLNHKGVFINGSLHTCSLADTRFTKEQFK